MNKENSRLFVCCSCNKIYYNFDYVIPHTICKDCDIVKCGNCSKNYTKEILKKLNINRKSPLKALFNHEYIDYNKPFPRKSLCFCREG